MLCGVSGYGAYELQRGFRVLEYKTEFARGKEESGIYDASGAGQSLSNGLGSCS